LLAPYVAWLAVRFPFGRGRPGVTVATHLAACAVFAAISHFLTARVDAHGIGVFVLSDHKGGTNFPTRMLTNDAPFVFGGDERVFVTNIQKSASHFATNRQGNATFITRVGDDGAEIKLLENLIPTNVEMEPLGQALVRHIAKTEIFHSETNLGNGEKGFARITTTSWASSWQSAPKPFALFLDLLAYGSLVGCAHAVHFYRRFREREQRALLLESHLTHARLDALQAQLHPHFLFNALNAVATLIRHDPDAALETLTSFSELLRLALSQSEKQEIPLRDDLRFLDRYVEIQQIRLGDRLRFEQ